MYVVGGDDPDTKIDDLSKIMQDIQDVPRVSLKALFEQLNA